MTQAFTNISVRFLSRVKLPKYCFTKNFVLYGVRRGARVTFADLILSSSLGPPMLDTGEFLNLLSCD